jgi:amino acid adenylation domain-containing protein
MTDILQRLARLPEGRRAEFLAQLRAEAKAAAPGGPVPRGSEGPAPLSFNQEPLWAYAQLAPDAPTYNMPFVDRLRGVLDLDALRGALASVVARHESLRTELVEIDGVPLQRVLPEVPVELPVIEIDGADEARRLDRLREVVGAEARGVIPLDRAPLWRARLYRLGAEDHVLLFLVHHAVFDGWSQSVFAADLAEYYRAARTGTEPKPAELPVQYPDFAVWQRESLSEQRLEELGRWWRARLAGAPILDFPGDRPRPRQITFTGTLAAWPLPAGALAATETLARTAGLTPFIVQTAAFLALLRRYTGQDDLVIGSPTANRGHSELEPVIGFFINQLVLRADLSGDPTFREVLDRVREVVQAAATHDIPLGKLVDAVRPPRDRSRLPLFQIAFALQETGSPLALQDLTTEDIEVPTGTSRFDMSWNVTRDEGDGELVVEYNTDLYDAETIDQFARLYIRLLGLCCAGPDQRLSELEVELLDQGERDRLLRFADAPTRPVRETTVVEQFELQAARSPQAVALVVRGEETSYAQLNARANRIARLLAAHGAGAGTIVGLALPRSADLLAAVLGVLKSGAAYLPLDTGHPPARIAGILADAQAVAVLADPSSVHLVEAPGLAVLSLDAAADLAAIEDGNPQLAASPGDAAYVITTSGSTGKPKGVLVEHRAVVNFIDNVTELFGLTAEDRVLGFASYTFDVSVFETFSALLNGARLYHAADEERLSPERLQALLADSGITVTDLPPAVMSLLDPADFKALRIVFVGGEAFSAELVNRWNPGRRLFNGYGPTECTVTMIVEECPGTWSSTPPIGLPMVNHVAHVLDAALRPVPFGVPGELVIGGAGLARGYLDRPELTAEKFVEDPFGTAPGGRLYRTGDLVKRRADGKLVFLGRIDRQVKIRGLRIELGEVESALAEFPGFGEVAVEPWTDDAGTAHLVGYAAFAGERPGTAALREFLGARLPGYMIPSHFVVLAELPLTASGKIDRKALPAPTSAGGGGEAVLAPRTETERVLVEEIVAPLLGIERVGVEDDFFQSGGNSLQAAQLISAINRRFGVEISLADFFLSPTPAHLATIVEGRHSAAMTDDELFGLLESLTDEEVGVRLEGSADDSAA